MILGHEYVGTVIDAGDGSFISNDTFPATVELLESGRLDLQWLVTHRFGLSEIHTAIDAMRGGEAIKVVIDPKR